jgi:DNA polymerase-3 subunit gamma/tau
MFELLEPFQKSLAVQMRNQIQEGTFSQVNLFGGPRYSLRMSFALEAARVLSCRRQGGSNCSCESCRKFATLGEPNVLIVSQRDHKSLIETHLDAFCRLYNDFSRIELMRTIRTLLLQYHPSFSPATASQNSLYDAASSVNELLISLGQEREIGQKEAKKWAEEIRSSLKPLYAANRKNTTVTIAQVRAIDEWVNQTGMGSNKRFIILEAMEQTNVSARNSLLKILEEPPEDTYFFLISEFPNRIMSTILSRVRRYVFPPLGQEAVMHYLKPYYLHDRQYESLEQFYLEGGGMDLSKNRQIAGMLFSSVQSRRYLLLSDLQQLLSNVDDMDGYEYVLRALLDMLADALEEESLSADLAYRLSSLVSSRYSEGRLYNQNGRLMLEALYYRMMEER